MYADSFLYILGEVTVLIYNCLKDADCLLILTECVEFRNPDIERLNIMHETKKYLMEETYQFLYNKRKWI